MIWCCNSELSFFSKFPCSKSSCVYHIDILSKRDSVKGFVVLRSNYDALRCTYESKYNLEVIEMISIYNVLLSIYKRRGPYCKCWVLRSFEILFNFTFSNPTSMYSQPPFSLNTNSQKEIRYDHTKLHMKN